MFFENGMEAVELMYPTHHKSALHAYQRVQNSAMSAKQTEVMAFNKAASRLKAASENMRDIGEYIAALQFNQRLWTGIQAALMEDDGRVPDPVRTKILNLSLFIDKQTLTAILKPDPRKLESLIEINRTLADGLMDGALAERTLN